MANCETLSGREPQVPIHFRCKDGSFVISRTPAQLFFFPSSMNPKELILHPVPVGEWRKEEDK